MATRRAASESLLDNTGAVLEPGEELTRRSAAALRQGASIPESAEPADPVEMQLMGVLEQLGETEGGGRVMVYRVTDDKRRPDAYLAEYSPEDFANDGLASIQRIYGGGMYKISVYGASRRLVANKIITIETAPGFKPEGVKEIVPAQAANAANDQLIMVMQAGFQRLGEMFVQAIQQVAPQKENRADFLREMAVMREIFAPTTQGGDASAAINTLLKGVELGKSLSPKGDSTESDVWMGLLETFGKPIVEAAMSQKPLVQAGHQSVAGLAVAHQIQGAGKIPGPPQIQGAIQPQTPVQAPSQIPGSENMSAQNLMLKNAVNFLVSQAARNNDPYTYANMILDQVDPDAVEHFLNNENWFANLCALNPKVGEYQDWFVSLRGQVVELLTPEGEESNTVLSPEPSAVTANAPGTPYSGKPGKPEG